MTSKSKTPTPAANAAALSALGANLDGDIAGAPGIDPEPVQAAADPGRVKIILEENENIPPSGQFFQIGGTDETGQRYVQSYLLRPGEEASVPRALLEVLDNAVMSTPIIDSQQSVVGYRDKLRFPYRVLSSGFLRG